MSYETPVEKAATARARKAILTRRLEDEAVIRGVMCTPAGRRWFHDKLASCSVGTTPWNPDPYATSFNCGQQNVGLMLLAELMAAAPNEYIQMMKENSNASGSDALPDSDASDASDSGDTNRYPGDP